MDQAAFENQAVAVIGIGTVSGSADGRNPSSKAKASGDETEKQREICQKPVQNRA